MRLHRHLLTSLLAAGLLFSAASTANANTFTMSSCAGVQIRPYPWVGDSTPWVRASDRCDSGEGLLVWADLAYGPQFPAGSWARWRLNPPGSLTIRRVRGLIRLVQGAGWHAGLYAHGHEYWLYGGPGCAYSCGYNAFVPFDLTGLNHHDISLLSYCAGWPCTTDVHSAMRDVEVTIDDPSPPQLTLTGGSLLNGTWLRGDATVSFQAADDSGVARTEVFVDGQRRVANDHACDRIVLPACEPSVGQSIALSTRLFAGDGSHRVTVRAVDFSGNITDASALVRADNTAPIAPLGLAPVRSEWEPVNRFAVRWSNPAQGNGASIAGARWRICPAESAEGAEASSCVSGQRDGANLSEISDLTVPGPGRWRLELALADGAGNADLANAAKLMLGFDDTPPDVGIELTDPQDPTRLRVSATDTVAPIVRGDVELRRRGSRAWRSVPTQLTTAGFDAVIDDERLRAGDYDVRAHAWNAAGLERSSENWSSGQPARLTLPLRIPTRVRLGAARKRGGKPRARAVLVRRPILAYGRRVRLTGQLTAPGGNPLVDVPVQVNTRIDGTNTAWRPAAELRTDRSGHFRYIVARGPSRLIQFRYPGTPTVRSITRTVPVRVRASSTITVSRRSVVNGDAVRFRGRIRGGHLPARKRVELQFYARAKWRTFASTRANRRGRWGYTYRFDGSRGTVRWRFRALITPENGYPYTTGRSRPVAVTVRGLP